MNKKFFRRIFFLNFLTKVLWMLLFGVIASFIFLGVYLIKGAAIQGQHNATRYYYGNAIVYTDQYKKESPNDTQGWWLRQNSGIQQQLEGSEYVRGVTRRTTMPAFLLYKEERIPVTLVIVENGDETVFSSQFQNGAVFAENTATLGIGLSAKYGVKEGDALNIVVPAWDALLTNQKIVKIYSVPDIYYQNYTIFVSKDTVKPYIDEAMKTYHLRFSATPFTDILITNLQPLIPGSRFVNSIDNIKHSLSVLTYLKGQMFKIYLVFSLFVGIFYAFMIYKYRAKNKTDFERYCFRSGISIPSMKFPLLLDFLQTGGLFALFSLLFSLIFEHLPFEFFIFSPYLGLFSQFHLQLSQGIVPSVDIDFLLKSIPLGLMIFVISGYGVMLLWKLFEEKERELSALLVLMVLTFLLTYIFMTPLLGFLSAKNERDRHLRDHFMGKAILKHKYHDQAMSFNTPVPAFRAPLQELNAIQNQGGRYLLRLTTPGELIQISKINTDVSVTNRFSTQFMGLRGNPPSELKNLVQQIESNQVIVGQNIAKHFPEEKILSFLIYGQKSNITVSLPIVVQEFDIPLYNDHVFMNIGTLASYIGETPDSVTEVFAYENVALENLKKVQEPNLELIDFEEQKSLFTSLEKSSVVLQWLFFFEGLAVITLLIVSCFSVGAVRTKLFYTQAQFWDKPRIDLSLYFFLFIAVVVGSIFTLFMLIPTLLLPNPLPEVLYLFPYTAPLMPRRFDFIAFCIIQACSLLFLGIGGMFLWWTQYRYYKYIFLHPELASEESPE